MARPAPTRFALPLLALLAACGGKSCSCLAPIPGGFPVDNRRHENAAQVRVTQAAFDYVQQHGAALVGALLPMGTTFDVPASCGTGNQVCCLNGQPQTCSLMIGLKAVGVTPNPGGSTANTLGLTVTTALQTKDPIPIGIRQVINADCYFAIDTAKAGDGTIDIVPEVTFAVDPATDLTSVAIKTGVARLDPAMIDITPQSGFGNLLACGLTNLGFIKGFVLAAVGQNLQDKISQTVESAMCSKCSSQSDCDAFADACMNGRCQRAGKCLQEVGVAGRLDVGPLLRKYSQGMHASMDLLAVLGGYAEVTAAASPGLSLGVLGGAEGGPHSPCVPVRPPPIAPMVDKWGGYLGETEPAGGKPYHVGIGVHESHLNTLAWAAFDGGALCLNVGTVAVPQLDSKTLGLLIPSLDDLVHSKDAPMFLAVRPSQEPRVTLGAGTFNVDATGRKTIKEPLLNVVVPELSIDFYALVEERYVRIMTLTADATLPVSLDIDGTGRIVPLLGDLTHAFTKVAVTNTSLLAEKPERLAQGFPMLLGLAASQFAGLAPFALPKVMGIDLKLVAIEPTADPSGALKFLSVFAELASGNMDAFHAATDAEVERVIAPPTERFRLDRDGSLDPAETPRVVLRLGGRGHGGGSSDLEWSARIDDGLWTPYSQAQRLEVPDPRLWLQGRHQVDVRARIIDEPATTDPEPVRREFLVDTVAPAGSADLDGDRLVLVAADAVSPPEAIAYSVRIGGAWSAWSHDTTVTLPAGALLAPAIDDLAARARDEAGNVGILEFHGRSTNPAGAGGCSCDLAARHHGGAPWAMIFVGAVAAALLLRRSKKEALLALAVIGIGASGCGGALGDAAIVLGNGDLLDPRNEVGRYSSAAAARGLIHVSAYDDSVGDLAYALIRESALAQPIQWQWVDGVPTDQPADMPGGYRGGVTAAGDDVGLYSSIALTAAGAPRIAYFDATHGALKFAAGSHRRFHAITVDAPSAGGRVGLYASLSLDAMDVPSIAYLATGLPDGNGGFSSALRLATAHGPSPAGPADWTIVDLDKSGIPCAGLCPKKQACLVTDKTDPTKSVCKPVDAAPCPAGCKTTQACIAAACVDRLPTANAPDLVEGVGLFANLVRLSSGARAVAYYDREKASLKLALETAPGSFTLSFVDGNNGTSDVGQFARATVGAGDVVHLAYVDAIADRVLYQPVKAGAAATLPEVIDDGMRMDGPHPVGAGVAIWTDPAAVRVVYQDQRTASLWQAARDAHGSWARSQLSTGNAGYGFYPNVVGDGAMVFLTQFVYDRAAAASGMDLGALQVTALAAANP